MSHRLPKGWRWQMFLLLNPLNIRPISRFFQFPSLLFPQFLSRNKRLIFRFLNLISIHLNQIFSRRSFRQPIRNSSRPNRRINPPILILHNLNVKFIYWTHPFSFQQLPSIMCNFILLHQRWHWFSHSRRVYILFRQNFSFNIIVRNSLKDLFFSRLDRLLKRLFTHMSRFSFIVKLLRCRRKKSVSSLRDLFVLSSGHCKSWI